MNYSLRQLLLVSLLSASLLTWGVTAYFSYQQTRKEVANLFDAELSQSAKVLHAFVENLLREGSLSSYWNLEKLDKQLHTRSLRQKRRKKSVFEFWSGGQTWLQPATGKQDFSVQGFASSTDMELWQDFDDILLVSNLGRSYERKIAFQLWSRKTGLLMRSESAPKYGFSDKDNGFSQTNIDDQLWHVFSISNSPDDYIIHVGQKEEIRAELTDEISGQLVTQFLIGLPILGVVIWLIVGQSLRPINRLEKSLARREANYLKPISTRKLPKEILPVVNEINNLFAQLEDAFEHERRFTSDAAHELRTPLAGLLTQAQVALRTSDDAVRKQALKRIEQAVNRMTYMVQQLLTFSRIEYSTEFLNQETTELGREIIQVVVDLEPEAHRKNIAIEVNQDNPRVLVANPALLAILIRNLVDNAIKYTPPNGLINITLDGKENQYVQLCVEDSGPGIAPDQYEKSLERFHRCTETAHTAQGTGLGFSIVERIACIHNADLILGVSPLGGLKVTVRFPLYGKAGMQAWPICYSFLNRLGSRRKAEAS